MTREYSIGQEPQTTAKSLESLQSVIFHSIGNAVSDELVEQT